jgi:hypothetical protein
MPAELFRTVTVRRRTTARRLGAVPLSVAFHAALLIAVVTIPLVATTTELPAPHVPIALALPPTPVVVVPSVPAPSMHARLRLSNRSAFPVVPPVGIAPDLAVEPPPPEITWGA